MRSLARLVAFALAVASLGTPTSAALERGTLSLILENDSFAGTDRNDTSGTRIPYLVLARAEHWLAVKQREAEAGDRSPTYVRELERYLAPGGHFSWWAGRSIHEVSYAALEDWSHWLADRGGGADPHPLQQPGDAGVTWLLDRQVGRRVAGCLGSVELHFDECTKTSRGRN